MIINLCAKKRSKIFSEQLIIRMQKKKNSPGKLEQEKCTNRGMSEDILGIVHIFSYLQQIITRIHLTPTSNIQKSSCSKDH